MTKDNFITGIDEKSERGANELMEEIYRQQRESSEEGPCLPDLPECVDPLQLIEQKRKALCCSKVP